MLAVGAMMQKAIEQLDAVAVIPSNVVQLFWIFRIVGFQWVEPLFFHPIWWALIENFDLIKGCFKILWSAPLYFERHIRIIIDIFGQPNGWKVTPTQFLNNDVPTDENLSNMHAMVPANFVVRHPLILRWICIFIKRFTQFEFQWSVLQIIVPNFLGILALLASSTSMRHVTLVAWWDLKVARLKLLGVVRPRAVILWKVAWIEFTPSNLSQVINIFNTLSGVVSLLVLVFLSIFLLLLFGSCGLTIFTFAGFIFFLLLLCSSILLHFKFTHVKIHHPL